VKRKLRTQNRIQTVAIVGYTNAGKSSLLRALTGDDIYVADQLFATLDPVSRRVRLPSNRHVLFTDTVGFIHKLPTTLIAAFRATLEEVRYADLLLHVADASHPQVLHHVEAVEDVLAEIDTPTIPRLLVWNKIDRLNTPAPIWAGQPSKLYRAEVSISAKSGSGISELLGLVDQTLSAQHLRVIYKIPYERGDILASLFNSATIQDQQYVEDGIIVSALILPTSYPMFSQYEWTE
jgi:GTPase